MDCMDWEFNLTRLYVYVSDTYADTLWPYCQKFSNNDEPEFTDEEAVAIYLFGMTEGHFKIKKIYEHTKKYLSDCFPLLPSYTAYVQLGLNRGIIQSERMGVAREFEKYDQPRHLLTNFQSP